MIDFAICLLLLGIWTLVGLILAELRTLRKMAQRKEDNL
jgi:hypothetical protein